MHLQLRSRPLQAKASYQRDWHHAMCHCALHVSTVKQLGSHGEVIPPRALQLVHNYQNLASVCP